MNEPDITDGMTLEDHKTNLAAFKAIKDRAAELEKRERAIVEDMMEPGETLNVMFGDVYAGKVEKTKGSPGNKWKVKDPLAYGMWLEQNGYGTAVYGVPMPQETAKTRSFLDHVIAEHGGELPDGVEPDGGRPATVRVTLDREAKRWMFERTELPSNARLLLENGGEL